MSLSMSHSGQDPAPTFHAPLAPRVELVTPNLGQSETAYVRTGQDSDAAWAGEHAIATNTGTTRELGDPIGRLLNVRHAALPVAV